MRIRIPLLLVGVIIVIAGCGPSSQAADLEPSQPPALRVSSHHLAGHFVYGNRLLHVFLDVTMPANGNSIEGAVLARGAPLAEHRGWRQERFHGKLAVGSIVLKSSSKSGPSVMTMGHLGAVIVQLRWAMPGGKGLSAALHLISPIAYSAFAEQRVEDQARRRLAACHRAGNLRCATPIKIEPANSSRVHLPRPEGRAGVRTVHIRAGQRFQLAAHLTSNTQGWSMSHDVAKPTTWLVTDTSRRNVMVGEFPAVAANYDFQTSASARQIPGLKEKVFSVYWLKPGRYIVHAFRRGAFARLGVDVSAPTSTMRAITCPAGIDRTNQINLVLPVALPSIELGFNGGPRCAERPGIMWALKVSRHAPGQIAMTQLVWTNIREGHATCLASQGWDVDNAFLYGGTEFEASGPTYRSDGRPVVTQDSPGMGLEHLPSRVRRVVETFRARDYLMYRPKGTLAATWVPLREMTWGFTVTAVRDAGHRWLIAPGARQPRTFLHSKKAQSLPRYSTMITNSGLSAMVERACG